MENVSLFCYNQLRNPHKKGCAIMKKVLLGCLGTVELIVELENRFDIRVPVSEFGRDDWNTANKIVEGVTELRNA